MVVSSLFLLLPFLAAAAVPKDSCQDVDYSPKLGLIRNQESSDWCWASSAADLVGFAQGLPANQQVSVVDMALTGMTTTEMTLLKAAETTGDWTTYLAARSEGPHITENEARKNGLRLHERQGWSLTAAIAYNQKPRVCLESDIPSAPPTPFRRGAANRPGAILSEDERSFIEEQLRSLGDGSQELSKVDKVQRILSTCVRPDAPVFQRYSDFFQEFNRAVLGFVAENAQKSCKHGPAVRPMTAEVADFNRGKDSPGAAKAAEWLSTGPLAVSLPSQLLNPGWNPSARVSKWHETVISGRRWNEKSGGCEFKLRNSYGPGCGRYSETFRARCEGGYVWLTEAELRDNARFASRVRAK